MAIVISAVIVVTAIFETVVAVTQKMGWMESLSPTFAVTGTFHNPGPLGGFLCVACGTIWCLFPRVIGRTKKWLCAIILGWVGLGLVIADSRAAWAGIAVVLAIGGYSGEYVRQLYKHKPVTVIVVAAIIMASALYAAYNHRPDSADGRLMVWRVALDMIADRPLIGFGAGGFNGNYMYYQAQYFSRHPDSKFITCADNVAYPFNEFIHVAVNFGVVGLLMCLMLIYAVMRRKNGINIWENGLRGGLVSLIVFGCFSYPSYVWRLWLTGGVIVLILAGGISSRIMRCGVCAVVLMVVCVGMAHEIEAADLRDRLMSGEELPICGELRRHPSLMDQWAIRIAAAGSDIPCAERIAMLEKAADVVPSVDLMCDIADVYRECGIDDRAEEYYRTASWMVPFRLRPRYGLFQLYAAGGRHLDALDEGERLLALPLKVRSTAALRIMADVKERMESFDSMVPVEGDEE